MEREYENSQRDGDDSRDENGVDPTLIRWMLSLSPRQRLDVLQKHVNSVLRLRESLQRQS